MNEELAKKVDRMSWNNTNAYITFRLLDGEARIENVFVQTVSGHDIPISEYVMSSSN